MVAGATNPGTLVSPDAGNGSGDLRAKLIERVTRELGERTDLCAYVDVDVVDDRLSDVVAAMVDVVLAVGWRAPADTEQAVADPGTWGPSDPKTELTKTIAETAAIPQWRAALAADFLLDEEGWRPPLPDSETEWGYQARSDQFVVECSEQDARAAERLCPLLYDLVQREVGPWTEVPS